MADPATGDARLAWQGGALLLFVSLIFPLQFEREWITLGWALEGFALLWLFHRLPHRGLRLVGGRPALRPLLSGSRSIRRSSNITSAPARRLELVSLRLRHHDRLSARRCAGSSDDRGRIRSNASAPAFARFVRRDSCLPSPQHRDRRLFFDRTDSHLFLLRKFCARHDLLDRLGALLRLRRSRRTCMGKVPYFPVQEAQDGRSGMRSCARGSWRRPIRLGWCSRGAPFYRRAIVHNCRSLSPRRLTNRFRPRRPGATSSVKAA